MVVYTMIAPNSDREGKMLLFLKLCFAGADECMRCWEVIAF